MSRPLKLDRGGYTIMGMTTSLAILAVAVTIVGQLAGIIAGAQRRSEIRRELAQEAGNLIERAMSLAVSDLNEDRIAKLIDANSVDSIAFRCEISKLATAEADIVDCTRIRIEAKSTRHPEIQASLVAYKHFPREAVSP